jgi:hypothetical protein
LIVPARRPNHHRDLRRNGSYSVANVEEIFRSLLPRGVQQDQVARCLETSGGERQENDLSNRE